MSLLGATLTFAESCKFLSTALGLYVTDQTIRIYSENIGEIAEKIEKEETKQLLNNEDISISKNNIPKRLVISADGAMVNTFEGWKEVRTGMLYEIDQFGNKVENKEYITGFEDHTTFGKHLYRLGIKNGTNKAKELIYIADGAKWLWTQADLHFPDAIHIVDWYHATEHLWQVANSYYGNGTKMAKKSARTMKTWLWKGKNNKVINRMKNMINKLEKPKKESPINEPYKIIQQNIGYFTRNKKRMRYKLFREKNLPIGSGPIESACKYVITLRFKGCGMRWNKKRANQLAKLRAIYLSGNWDSFWDNIDKVA